VRQAKEPVAAKVDPKLKAKLEQVAEEAGTTLSVIAHRGLRYYAKENPDRYEALRSQDCVDRMLEEL